MYPPLIHGHAQLKRTLCLIFFFCSGLFLPDTAVFSQEGLVSIPKLTSRVTDLTGSLSRPERLELEGMLRSFEEKKGAQIVLLIIPTTKPEPIEDYAIRLADSWKIGRKKVDDGAILLVAKNDRRLRIEVGYGLEGSLTDILSNQIIRKVITPFFKEGNFYQGVKNGLLAMMKVVDGEELPAYQRKLSSRNKPGQGSLIFLFLFVALGFLMRSWLGSGFAFVVNLIFGVIIGYLFLNLISGVFMALFGTLLSNRGMGSGLGMMGMGGMGGGRYGGGGFGGGGFGGGGGGFGGGGSSGSW